MNENCLTRAGFRGMVQGVIGGDVGNPDSGALGECDFCWKGMHLGFKREGIFGVGAGDRPSSVDAIPGFHFLDAIAHGFHDSGAVGTWCVRQRWLYGICSGAHVGIVGIDAGGVDAHQNLPRGGFRRGNFLELHYLRSAEFMDDDRFHNCFSFRP
jgi:hypothetical protein